MSHPITSNDIELQRLQRSSHRIQEPGPCDKRTIGVVAEDPLHLF